ncbi:hypothetical protein MUK42_33224 [Musa troglodytarum]|uniref:Uncharacterized protein n=1 Tax=Musa troglodytarum TaxID=320322 RepID=A0A9E7FDA8_9LILI|nr:hypothetical protein MUK42_33224 [Musa troglodytarum]
MADGKHISGFILGGFIIEAPKIRMSTAYHFVELNELETIELSSAACNDFPIRQRAVKNSNAWDSDDEWWVDDYISWLRWLFRAHPSEHGRQRTAAPAACTDHVLETRHEHPTDDRPHHHGPPRAPCRPLLSPAAHSWAHSASNQNWHCTVLIASHAAFIRVYNARENGGVPGEIGIAFCGIKQPITVFERCGFEQPVSHRRHTCPWPPPLQMHPMVQQYE